MELRHLRYFIAVAEELNFTKAAARLHIAPPPLSVQIRNLEAEIGTELLSRESRGIKLTEAGHVFLEHARKTLADAKLGATLAQKAARGETGHLSIGYSNPAGFLVFPRIVPAFRQRWPDIHLMFHDLKVTQQLEGLRREELDLAFVWLPTPTDEFDQQELLQEPLVAALPKAHPLAGARSVSIKELSKEPLVLLRRSLDPETYHAIELAFRSAGATMNVAYELEALLSLINFVAMGSGCSIVPQYARSLRPDSIAYLPLQSPNIFRSLAILKRRRSSSAAEAFYRFTAEQIATAGLKRKSATRRRRDARE